MKIGIVCSFTLSFRFCLKVCQLIFYAVVTTLVVIAWVMLTNLKQIMLSRFVCTVHTNTIKLFSYSKFSRFNLQDLFLVISFSHDFLLFFAFLLMLLSSSLSSMLSSFSIIAYSVCMLSRLLSSCY